MLQPRKRQEHREVKLLAQVFPPTKSLGQVSKLGLSNFCSMILSYRPLLLLLRCVLYVHVCTGLGWGVLQGPKQLAESSLTLHTAYGANYWLNEQNQVRIDIQKGRKEGKKGGRVKEGERGKEEGRQEGKEGRKLLSPASLVVTQRVISSWLVSKGGGDHDGWWSSSLITHKTCVFWGGALTHHFHFGGRGTSCSWGRRTWGVLDKDGIADSVRKLPPHQSLQSAPEKTGPRCCLRYSQGATRDKPESQCWSPFCVPHAPHHKGCN